MRIPKSKRPSAESESHWFFQHNAPLDYASVFSEEALSLLNYSELARCSILMLKAAVTTVMMVKRGEVSQGLNINYNTTKLLPTLTNIVSVRSFQ